MKPRSTQGFTLVELLVVVAVIAILASVGIVTLRGSREKADDVAAKSLARNALSAAASIISDKGSFNGIDLETLRAEEPSLTWQVSHEPLITILDTEHGKFSEGLDELASNVVAFYGLGSECHIVTRSKSGTLFGILMTTAAKSASAPNKTSSDFDLAGKRTILLEGPWRNVSRFAIAVPVLAVVGPMPTIGPVPIEPIPEPEPIEPWLPAKPPVTKPIPKPTTTTTTTAPSTTTSTTVPATTTTTVPATTTTDGPATTVPAPTTTTAPVSADGRQAGVIYLKQLPGQDVASIGW